MSLHTSDRLREALSRPPIGWRPRPCGAVPLVPPPLEEIIRRAQVRLGLVEASGLLTRLRRWWHL